MSKKRKQEQKIAKEKINDKKNTTDQAVEKQETDDVKAPQTQEELLTIEKDKNLRLFAEFENFRRRTAKEKLELFSTANKDIMTVLLPILDNFERSIKANNYSDEDGTVLIYKQLKSELEKKGLTEMEDPIGEKLNTDLHEAISNIPAQKKADEGKIMDVIEKGYLLGTKVLRYAKVVVANKK